PPIPPSSCPRLLRVGDMPARVAAEHRLLAAFGDDHKFVTLSAAYGAGIGVDDEVVETAALKDSLVGASVRVEGAVQAGFLVIEAVGVLHRELAPSNQTAARPRLVSELGLDLVERERELLPRVDVATHDIRDHLLMRKTEE